MSLKPTSRINPGRRGAHAPSPRPWTQPGKGHPRPKKTHCPYRNHQQPLPGPQKEPQGAIADHAQNRNNKQSTTEAHQQQDKSRKARRDPGHNLQASMPAPNSPERTNLALFSYLNFSYPTQLSHQPLVTPRLHPVPCSIFFPWLCSGWNFVAFKRSIFFFDLCFKFHPTVILDLFPTLISKSKKVQKFLLKSFLSIFKLRSLFVPGA